MSLGEWDPRCEWPRGLVRPVGIDPTGVIGPTRRQAQGSRWRRTSPGRYLPSALPSDLPEQRILEQAQRCGDSGVLTGWAALRVWGASYFDGVGAGGPRPVPVLENGGRIWSTPQATVSHGRVPSAEIRVVHGLRCVVPERALVDELRQIDDERERVVALDMAMAGYVTSRSRMEAHLASRNGARGVRRVRRALDLADEGSRSPQESRLRLIWELDVGWSRPLCNVDVFGPSGFIGRPDLLDPVHGIVGEYDGAIHRTRERHARDVEREADFRAVGLECVTVVGEDLDDVATVRRRLAEARERAGRQPRRWTVRPSRPPLDDILAFRDRQGA